MSDATAELQKLLADPAFHLEGRAPDDELRESMKANGWLESIPAIIDGDGTVISGHRRMAVAKELGIEPVTQMLPPEWDDGSEGDMEVIRLALASNVGGKPWTPEQRKQIAELLYGQAGWSMAKIAKALSVSQPTITRDLIHVNNPPERGGRPTDGDTRAELKKLNQSMESDPAQRTPANYKRRDQLADRLRPKSASSKPTVSPPKAAPKPKPEPVKQPKGAFLGELQTAFEDKAEAPPHVCVCKECGRNMPPSANAMFDEELRR